MLWDAAVMDAAVMDAAMRGAVGLDTAVIDPAKALLWSWSRSAGLVCLGMRLWRGSLWLVLLRLRRFALLSLFVFLLCIGWSNCPKEQEQSSSAKSQFLRHTLFPS